MMHSQNARRWVALGRLATLAAFAALAAGCGLQSAAALPGQAVQWARHTLGWFQQAKYATDSTPLNRTAMEAAFGQTFPGLVITPQAVGAPATPPFSLAGYPAQHAVLWTSLAQSQASQAWERQGAETAAQWVMAGGGNRPLDVMRYWDLSIPVPSGFKNSGATTGEQVIMYHVAQQFLATIKAHGGYTYRQWAVIKAVQPYSAKYWPGGPLDQYLGSGQKVVGNEAEVVWVANGQVNAIGGHFEEDVGGAGPVLVANIQGLGWKVILNGAFLGQSVKRLPGTYVTKIR